MTFYDREQELAALESAYDSPDAEFLVIYGRRRVGKTELLKKFCAGRRHLYFLAAQESGARQREKFVERIATEFDDRVPRIDDWPAALDYLGEKVSEDRLTVVIDEFPYLVESNDSLPSYLQGFVDEQLADTESLLVLCGSSIGVMESEVLGHESPLYGRRTAQLDLQPFSFATANDVIGYEFVDAIRSFSVTGGTPMYLTLFEYAQSLADNIRAHVLNPTTVLYNEPEFLLRTELRNPGRYMSILEAVAAGHTTPNEIAGATDIDSGPLSKYLQTLRRLRLLDREVPVTAASKKTNRSLYRVADEFLRFWFRFVEPNRSGIEEAPDVVLRNTIMPALPQFVSSTFEDVCREAVWAAIRAGTLEGYSEVGRWWYGEDEIDIVALDPSDDSILLGECKWTSNPVGYELVEDLQRKAKQVRWGPDSRTETFALFSKAGYVDGLAEKTGENWHLYSLSDLDGLLSSDDKV